MPSDTASMLTAASIVTFNNKATVVKSIEALLAQTGYVPGENLLVFVTDNASVDGTAEELQRSFAGVPGLRLTLSTQNLGFCAAHNAAIASALEAGADYVLVLNPDLRLEFSALAAMTRALNEDPSAGMCCPKLYRARTDLEPVEPRLLDSAGMYITPELRHFDRGSNESPQPEHELEAYVFGASGAAVLFSREFVLDCSFTDRSPSEQLELFDESFFAYREDADLSWRALRLGWRCVYCPKASGYHVRHVLPDNRSKLRPELNRYSVRNRFLLQLNNVSPIVAAKCLPGLLWRNMLVIGAALTVERSSLPALGEAFKGAGRALRRNQTLRRRSRVRGFALSRWFSCKPYKLPSLTARASTPPIRRVTAIVVNFNSGPRLKGCIGALQSAAENIADIDLHTIVVDNASQDCSARAAQAESSHDSTVSFALLEQNLGFAGGINYGAEAAPADAYLVLNPDLQIDSSAIRVLCSTLDRYPDLAVAAPLLVGEDGELQTDYTFRRLPSLGHTVAELCLLHRLWPTNPWTSHYYMLDEDYVGEAVVNRGSRSFPASRPLVIEQPAGACLLIRHSDFEAIGGFDSRFYPAWFEDVDFANRLAVSGRLAGVCLNAEARHEGGYSVHSLSSLEFRAIWYRNLLRYWAKHGSALEYYVLRLLVPIGAALRLLPTLFHPTSRDVGTALRSYMGLLKPLPRDPRPQ